MIKIKNQNRNRTKVLASAMSLGLFCMKHDVAEIALLADHMHVRNRDVANEFRSRLDRHRFTR